jgi:hypothetical protein
MTVVAPRIKVMETPSIEPDTEAWDLLRERALTGWQKMARGTNTGRDGALEVGDVFVAIAPPGQRGVSNRSRELLARMAEECGIAARTAVNLRDLSAQIPAGGDFREMLADASDIAISWDTVRALMARSREPLVDLTRLIKATREAGETRLRRDDVRRTRGIALHDQALAAAPQPKRAPESVEVEPPRPDYNYGPEWQKVIDRPHRHLAADELEVTGDPKPVEQASRPAKVLRLPDRLPEPKSFEQERAEYEQQVEVWVSQIEAGLDACWAHYEWVGSEHKERIKEIARSATSLAEPVPTAGRH